MGVGEGEDEGEGEAELELNGRIGCRAWLTVEVLEVLGVTVDVKEGARPLLTDDVVPVEVPDRVSLEV